MFCSDSNIFQRYADLGTTRAVNKAERYVHAGRVSAIKMTKMRASMPLPIDSKLSLSTSVPSVMAVLQLLQIQRLTIDRIFYLQQYSAVTTRPCCVDHI